LPRITSIPARRLRRVFELAGFACVRTEEDHHVFSKEGVSRPVVIPDYDEVPVFIIRNNLRTAGISRDEYFQLLQKT
jgi:predicted RNA binding protein YcfA (HicA-like mRNA interferase family)